MKVPAVDGRAGKVPRASEGVVRGSSLSGEIYRDTEGSLDVCLREVAEIVVWRERVRVNSSKIVVVTAGVFGVRAVNVPAAGVDGFRAGIGDRIVVAVVVRVALGFGGLALEDSSEAAGFWFVPMGEGCVVGCFINGLDAVGVVIGYRWVG